MKYKAGDKIRLRKDLKAGEYYGTSSRIYCTSEMASMAGKVFTIKEYYPALGHYKLLGDANEWRWSDKMFEGLTEDMQEKTIKLYTQQDLCTYESLLNEKLHITNEYQTAQNQGLSALCKLYSAYLKIIHQMIDNLGHEVDIDEAKSLLPDVVD